MTQPDARAERTEPATGEDVEKICDVLVDFLPQYDERNRHDAAVAILAALDLPGRMEALREEISAEELARATDAAEYGYQAEFNRLTAERDDALQRLANVTSALDDLKNAYDQLHVARDNTARLLEEARAETQAVDRAHREINSHITMEGCDECPESAEPCPAMDRWHAVLYAARQHAGGEGGGS